MNKSILITCGAIVIAASALSILGCSKEAPSNGAAAEGSAALEPGKGHGRASAELAAACDGKKNGDECSAKMGDREIKGQCTTRPENTQSGQLFCRPTRHAPPAQ